MDRPLKLRVFAFCVANYRLFLAHSWVIRIVAIEGFLFLLKLQLLNENKDMSMKAREKTNLLNFVFETTKFYDVSFENLEHPPLFAIKHSCLLLF